jgi:hypothetical protein
MLTKWNPRVPFSDLSRHQFSNKTRQNANQRRFFNEGEQMASISKDSNGDWIIQFAIDSRKRETLWLGDVPRRDASEVKRRIELLVKAHRLGWRIGEVPARWLQRAHGASRFQVVKWLPSYLRWYAYAFATTYLRRPATSVPHKNAL